MSNLNDLTRFIQISLATALNYCYVSFVMKLSVIIPVHNEKNTIREILKRVNDVNIPKEIIIVDDKSSDGTRDILKNEYEEKENIKIIYKEKNEGKTSAIAEGLKHTSGDVVIVQDADLEYDPQDFSHVIEPIVKGRAEVVYGSRFLDKKYKFNLWLFANKFLTYLTNLFCGLKLTDMETCYKAFKKEVLEGIKIESERFGFEPEITVKITKKKIKIVEVPISYEGRKFSEGKKISAKDGLWAIYIIVKYSLFSQKTE